MAESKEAQGQEQEDHSNSWLGDFVRLTIMIWAMGVITANYLGIFKQSIDVTFSASLLSSTAASYGLSVGRNGQKKKEEKSVSLESKTTTSATK
jgi:hypothetical protein|tara:strand:- start:171 stop:452 length:282 start_codon:yes stop_codon:yes gene_type:complete